MAEQLKIVYWPDPRLLKQSVPVSEFTPALHELAMQMFELMRGEKGVGLAAPQVGKNIRMFVMNATGKPEDDRIYVNPILSEPVDEDEAEEGCLSLPEVRVVVNRNKSLHMQAQDLNGKPFEETETGFPARVWQHEFDHLNGVLITDRMGMVDKLKYRKTLREMEEKYAAEHPPEVRNPKSQTRNKSKSKRTK